MLVITRKEDQTIRIGTGVVVTVLKTKTGSVKVGVEAPKDELVLRGELEKPAPTS